MRRGRRRRRPAPPPPQSTPRASAGPPGGRRCSPAPPAAAVHVTSIGRSVRGRQLIAVHRWRPGEPAVRVLVVGQVHGNERAGVQISGLLRRASLPAGLDLWVLPTANPDGLAAGTRLN